MPRTSTPAHQRKSGPGTGGRNVDRDKEICALNATGLSNGAIAKQFKVSSERVRQVLWQADRDAAAGRTRWMSTAEKRAEIQRSRNM
jgi:transposase